MIEASHVLLAHLKASSGRSEADDFPNLDLQVSVIFGLWNNDPFSFLNFGLVIILMGAGTPLTQKLVELLTDYLAVFTG